jgi:putative Flp pilus-assembly TadE/G-like protein
VLTLFGEDRGAVAVFVAVLILPLMMLLAFAVDTGNWWTHKRHLQTQADAGTLAGAQGPWFPACDRAAIENAARQYSGDLGSGYNPQYTNSTNVHTRINSTAFWPGGANGDPCATLNDPSQPAFLDLKLTESSLLNFFGSIPGFSSVTVHSHARVEIQGLEQEDDVRPIAVRDDSEYRCGQVQLVDTSTGGVVQTVDLPSRTVAADGSYTQFQNPGGTAVTMPSAGGHHLYVRVKLGDCAGNDDIFPTDDQQNPVGGVNFINSYPTTATTPDPNSNEAPVIRSVSLANGGCNPDQYYSTNSCSVTVKAYISFQAGSVYSGGSQNTFVRVTGTNVNSGDSTTADATPGSDSGGAYWLATFGVSSLDGPQSYTVDWAQKSPLKIGTDKCTNGSEWSGGNKCQGGFGLQQQDYSWTDDDGENSSSGEIALVQVGEVGVGTVGANSFAQGSAQTLVFTVRVQGLTNSACKEGSPRPCTDPPIILRYSVQGSKRTGAVDCGQQNSGNPSLQDAIVNGCPSPVYLWNPGDACVSPNDVGPPTPINCVVPIPGNKGGINGVIGGVKQRIGNSCNNWNAWASAAATPIPADDPRKITLLVTSPANLTGGGGSSVEVPVLNAATFYVTGVDTYDPNSGDPNCKNEPYPRPTDKKNLKKDSIWGHFIKNVQLGGIGNNEWCDPSKFGDCVAVLTQ